MDAAKMREILLKDFGIKNEAEFEAAILSMEGVNLGVFQNDYKGNEYEKEEKNVA